jgi:hypothetical protein
VNNGISELEKMLVGCGYVFRHFPDARYGLLRYQAGRMEQERVIIPAKIATGRREVEMDVEVFCLVAFAETAQELIQKLDGIDTITL